MDNEISSIAKEAIENPAKATQAEKEALLVDEKFIKLTGADKWTADEKAEFVAKGFRSLRANEKPIVSPVVRPSDYNNDLARGSVSLYPGVKNYSFFNVEIPDGSTLEGHNFTQIQPDTDCITGDNLTLIDCNLGNVRLNPTWTLINCNTSQFWIVEEEQDGETQEVTQFICSHPSELPSVETKVPEKAILSRSF